MILVMKGNSGRSSFQRQWSTVAILNVGGMNHGFKIQTERIDRDMAFFTVDLLAIITLTKVAKHV
jgi:hypothetical protein